jgi:hypothetical protein
MREWCDQAGLPHCTAHGLKNAAATICAAMGAADRQMMARLIGRTRGQATVYTKKANRTSMAAAAGALLASFSWNRLAECPEKNKVSKRLPKLLILFNSGRSGGTRTPNPRFWRPVL